MPPIADLWNKHPNTEIYIVGTGASLRVFPIDFFKNKITIGLNQAYKSFPSGGPTYNLTIHSNELIPKDFAAKNQLWVTKQKGSFQKSKLTLRQKERIYWFTSNSDPLDFSYCYPTITTTNGGQGSGSAARLYVGRGIHTAASILGARMGARTLVLVGCDFCPIDNQHHVTDQTVRFHGMPPDGVYREYYENFKRVRSIVEKEYNCNILQLNAFAGLPYWGEDYEHLLKEKGLEKFPSPKDDSRYVRKKLDFTPYNS